MKTIQPVTSWINGQSVQAVILYAYVINDNLQTSASFFFTLLDDQQQNVTMGNLTMEGDAYTAYDSNEYAYNWVASQLNLTIIGDYVPPVSPTE
jgi:hypothetical protein